MPNGNTRITAPGTPPGGFQFGDVPALSAPSFGGGFNLPNALNQFLLGLRSVREDQRDAAFREARQELEKQELDERRAAREQRSRAVQERAEAIAAEKQRGALSTDARVRAVEETIAREFPQVPLPALEGNVLPDDALALREASLKRLRDIQDSATRAGQRGPARDPDVVDQDKDAEAVALNALLSGVDDATIIERLRANRAQVFPKLTDRDLEIAVVRARNRISIRGERESLLQQLLGGGGALGEALGVEGGAEPDLPPATPVTGVSPMIGAGAGLPFRQAEPAEVAQADQAALSQAAVLAGDFSEIERAQARQARDALIAQGLPPGQAALQVAQAIVAARGQQQ